MQDLTVAAFDSGFVEMLTVTEGVITVIDPVRPKLIMALNYELSSIVDGSVDDIFTGYVLYVTTGNVTESRLIISYKPYYYSSFNLFRVSVVLQSELTVVPTLTSTYRVVSVLKQKYFGNAKYISFI